MEIYFKKIFEKDVDLLEDISILTFAQAYKHLNSASNYSSYIQSAFNVSKLLSEIQNKESLYYFILDGDEIIGYLKMNIGNSQTERHSEDYLEIERIYLVAQYKKQGLGKRMIQFAFDKAIEYGKTKVWLGVWDRNPDAILFYEHVGFREKGSHIFKFGDEDQIDIIMEMDVPLAT